jgi:ornithine cyclodeaminase
MATIGCGPIAATVVDFLMASGWEIARFRVHDVTAARAHQFSARLRDRGYEAVVSGSAADAARGAGLVLFATTAGAPHLEDSALFTPEQTVLHISLRDLGVPIILSVQNFVDDIEHCMKAQTSLHLAEQATGGRSFVDGTIGDLLAGEAAPDPNRVRVFSPFGLGVLDIAVARFVFQQAVGGGQALVVEEFFASAPCSN